MRKIKNKKILALLAGFSTTYGVLSHDKMEGSPRCLEQSPTSAEFVIVPNEFVLVSSEPATIEDKTEALEGWCRLHKYPDQTWWVLSFDKEEVSVEGEAVVQAQAEPAAEAHKEEEDTESEAVKVESEEKIAEPAAEAKAEPAAKTPQDEDEVVAESESEEEKAPEVSQPEDADPQISGPAISDMQRSLQVAVEAEPVVAEATVEAEPTIAAAEARKEEEDAEEEPVAQAKARDTATKEESEEEMAGSSVVPVEAADAGALFFLIDVTNLDPEALKEKILEYKNKEGLIMLTLKPKEPLKKKLTQEDEDYFLDYFANGKLGEVLNDLCPKEPVYIIYIGSPIRKVKCVWMEDPETGELELIQHNWHGLNKKDKSIFRQMNKNAKKKWAFVFDPKAWHFAEKTALEKEPVVTSFIKDAQTEI